MAPKEILVSCKQLYWWVFFMEKNGWIKLHRKIQESELWFAEPFTKAQAWVDIILSANHKDKSIYIRGVEVKLKRGQLGWSEITMAKRWKWSRNKVRRFLTEQQTKQRVEQQKSNKTTVITVKNYEDYQGDGTANDTANETQTRSKEVKNYRNIDNIYSDKNKKNNAYKDFDRFQLNDGCIAIMRFGVWCDSKQPYPKIDRSYYKECPPNL